MKKLIYTIVVFLILHCTLYIDNCICQWVQYEFIGGVSVYSFAVSGNNIFAGTDNGVFLSTNNGQNWTQTALTYWSHSLAVSGNNPEDSGQVIFAGTINYGVYLSTNNGVTWTQTALNNRTVYSIAVSGNNPEDSGQ
ncbi:MAG: hypothetical protein FJ216_11505, partial [Ignavibacteria bacterium]|nr:hypothetical protein [Ignavibacteria bacterium]